MKLQDKGERYVLIFDEVRRMIFTFQFASTKARGAIYFLRRYRFGGVDLRANVLPEIPSRQ
jgi:hypothetical protein